MSEPEVENLPFKLLAVLYDYNKILHVLLKLLVLEHVNCSDKSQSPNTALADIIKKADPDDLSALTVLRYPVTLEKFYDVSSVPYKIRDSINIDSLDITPIVEILKFIKGFPTYVKDKSNRCLQPDHKKKCCRNCDHKCVICSNPQCRRHCAGVYLDHKCRNCPQKKSECIKYKTVCCATCNSCLKCLESEDGQCATFKLKHSLDIVHFLRNTFCHISPSDCADFMAGLITLKLFPSSTNWDKLSQEILKAADHILSYMCDVLPNPIDTDMKTSLYNQVLQSCELEKNLPQCMKKIERSFKVLGKDLMSIKDDLEKEIKKLQEDMKKLNENFTLAVDVVKDLPTKVSDQVEKVFRDYFGEEKVQKSIKGIEKASNSLKKKYIERFSKVPKNAAIERKHNLSQSVPREKLITDNILETEKKPEGSSEVVVSKIKSDQLFDKETKYVVMTGDSGVGKTTFIETLVYRWAKGEIWNGNSKDVPFFKFVFLLRCRELTRYKQSEKLTLEYLLENEYKNIYQKQFLTDDNYLLIIEGFDELIVFNEFKTSSSNSMSGGLCQCLYDILNPEKLSYRLITSRTIGSHALFRKFKNMSHKMNKVTFKGFSQNGMRYYISSYFGAQSEKTELVTRKLEEGRLFTLATRPFFCWAYCSLMEDSMEMELPETFSEIFSSIIILFMRNHGEKETKELSEFINSKNVKSAIFNLAEIAYLACYKDEVIFSKKDLGRHKAAKEIDRLSSNFGLIERVDGDELGNRRYQFVYLPFQEFFAAFHVFHNSDEASAVKISEKHPYILLFLSGFLGNREIKGPQKVIRLLSQLKNSDVPDIEFRCLFEKATVIEQRNELYNAMIFEFQDKLDELPPIKALTLHTPQHLLSSYDIICIHHLFKAINDENQHGCKFPFKELTLSLKHVPEEIFRLFKPYLNRLNKLSLPTFDDKYIDDLVLCIPNLHTIELPHCGVTEHHWKRIFESIKSDVNRQLKCFFIRDSMEYILNGYLWYVEHDQLIESSSYENLHIFEKAGVGVDVHSIDLLINSIKQNKVHLEFLSLKIRDIATFKILCKEIDYLKSIKRMKVFLSLTCDHKKEEGQTIRKEEFLAKRIVSKRGDIFQKDFVQSVIVCKKCQKNVRSCLDKIKDVFRVEIPMLISHYIINDVAEFYLQIILNS